jgi:antitoxin YefM
MYMMKTLSYTAARSNFKSTMEEVCADHAPMVITRKNGEPVVLLSLEDYHAMEETMYLMRSPKNAKRLLEAITDLESNQFEPKQLLDE